MSRKVMAAILAHREVGLLVSADHFSVDGTLEKTRPSDNGPERHLRQTCPPRTNLTRPPASTVKLRSTSKVRSDQTPSMISTTDPDVRL